MFMSVLSAQSRLSTDLGAATKWTCGWKLLPCQQSDFYQGQHCSDNDCIVLNIGFYLILDFPCSNSNFIVIRISFNGIYFLNKISVSPSIRMLQRNSKWQFWQTDLKVVPAWEMGTLNWWYKHWFKCSFCFPCFIFRTALVLVFLFFFFMFHVGAI